MTEYLTLSDLLAAAEAAVGGPPEVRDYGLLAAAADRPRATVFGTEAYADVHVKAAALLHSLARNHPLVDGNKRLAWVATRLFYVLNGHDVAGPHDPAYDLVIGAATGTADVPEIAARLSAWAKPAG